MLITESKLRSIIAEEYKKLVKYGGPEYTDNTLTFVENVAEKWATSYKQNSKLDEKDLQQILNSEYNELESTNRMYAKDAINGKSHMFSGIRIPDLSKQSEEKFLNTWSTITGQKNPGIYEKFLETLNKPAEPTAPYVLKPGVRLIHNPANDSQERRFRAKTGGPPRG